MANAVTAVSAVLNAEALWGEVSIIAPLIGAMAVFAFAWGIFKKFVRKVPKGKSGV